jgi:hypothetical protein
MPCPQQAECFGLNLDQAEDEMVKCNNNYLKVMIVGIGGGNVLKDTIYYDFFSFGHFF